jgi:hypothetical protein
MKKIVQAAAAVYGSGRRRQPFVLLDQAGADSLLMNLLAGRFHRLLDVGRRDRRGVVGETGGCRKNTVIPSPTPSAGYGHEIACQKPQKMDGA